MAYADPPHTDPGDGRTECDTCGKWVHEVIHSCKGIPVTEAARKRAYERQPDVIGFGQWEKCGGPCCGGASDPNIATERNAIGERRK